MSATIKKYTLALLAGSAFVLASLSLLPSVAVAQDETPTQATQNANPPGAAAPPNALEPEGSLVVNSGDNLWLIAQYELGPEATPEQVLIEVQKIYRLNQTRIGGDPNLIFAGQVLSLPPVVAAAPTPRTGPEDAREPSTNEPTTRTPQEAPAEEIPAAGSAAEAPEEQPAEELPVAESAPEAPEEQPAEAPSEAQDMPVSEAVPEPEEAEPRLLSYTIVTFGLIFTIILVLFLVFLARRVPAKKW